MNKDILEQYISNHREAFDVAVPKDQIWANIAQNLVHSDRDDLEQYIDRERETFDIAIPNLKIWENIATELESNPKDALEQFIESERPAFDIATPSLQVWENIDGDLDSIDNDNLEQFISRDRESFDTGIPSLKVWSNINKDLSQRKAKRVTLWKSLKVAASVVILLIAGATMGSYLTKTSSGTHSSVPQIVAEQQESQEKAIEEIAPEFVKMEQVFNTEVDSRIQQLASYQHDNLVKEDLEQLDLAMEELKRELLKAPKGTEQQILDNLIESYKTKLAILERVLERVQTNKPIKTSNNEVSI